MHIDIAAAMAEFVKNGGAITTLDYAGNPVGQHQDVDLNPDPNPVHVDLKHRGGASVTVNLTNIATPAQRAAKRLPPTFPAKASPPPTPTVQAAPAMVPVVEEAPPAPTVDVAAELARIRTEVASIRRRVEYFESLAA